ncbi:MAG: RDD family protein [Lentisphaeria bacterium]|nr:RDD family protein [Lentisphaeria bacterium]
MATWYFVENGGQQGPLADADFRRAVDSGRIGPQTLVWNETMSGWQALREVQAAQVQADAEALSTGGTAAGAGEVTPLRPSTAQPASAAAPSAALTCAECGLSFPPDELIPIAGRWVCAGCKPMALQKFREGVGLPGTLRYGGFWIRFAAKFIDGLILFGVNFSIGLVVQGIFAGIGAAAGGDVGSGVTIAGAVVAWLIQVALGACYTTFFLGKFAATPGKMACGLRVVRADGSALTYARSCGRHFADMLSGITLCIGYIIAAFDAEKRALHDHICDTRVVYKS